jgi:membrane protein YqaA with SNARE-associated domain
MMPDSKPPLFPRSQQMIAILWPSFVTAILASGLFFSAFNPRDLLPFDLDIEFSPVAAYSIGFFLFWIIALVSSVGTLFFAITNYRPPGLNRDKPGPQAE